MQWSKQPNDVWTSRAGPLAIAIKPKGDGRWMWSVHKDGTPNPTATGVSSSLNTAKRTTENFVSRSGFDT